MKKYSLFIIAISLVIIVAVSSLILFKKTIVAVKDKQWVEEYLKKATREQENKNNEKTDVINEVVAEKQDTTYYAITENSPIYKFEDFPAKESFNGTPALPNFKTNPKARMFETVTIAGTKNGPGFAGAFTVVEYGCGTNCQLHTILNTKSGAIISYDELLSFYGIDYRLNSRLLVVNPKEALVENFGNEIPSYFKTKYYELSEDGLKLKELGVKEEPSFNDVIAGGCCIENCSAQKYNPYLGKKVQWKAVVSDYAHTSGIRFIVIDKDHSIESYKNHGLFYGTFLASANDPRTTEEGLMKWNDKWKLSWVEYIMDVYGNIQDKDRKDDTIFLVSADIGNVDCDYDGGYIETKIEKIEKMK